MLRLPEFFNEHLRPLAEVKKVAPDRYTMRIAGRANQKVKFSLAVEYDQPGYRRIIRHEAQLDEQGHYSFGIPVSKREQKIRILDLKYNSTDNFPLFTQLEYSIMLLIANSDNMQYVHDLLQERVYGPVQKEISQIEAIEARDFARRMVYPVNTLNEIRPGQMAYFTLNYPSGYQVELITEVILGSVENGTGRTRYPLQEISEENPVIYPISANCHPGEILGFTFQIYQPGEPRILIDTQRLTLKVKALA
jgi:hypothetical protein